MPGISLNERNACFRMNDCIQEAQEGQVSQDTHLGTLETHWQGGDGGNQSKNVLPYDRAHPQIYREGEFFSGGGVT